MNRVQTAVETLLEINAPSDNIRELPDLRANRLTATGYASWNATQQSEGAAYAIVLDMYRAFADALKERISVEWAPDAGGSFGRLSAYVFTPGELRAVIEAAYNMGFDGKALHPWYLSRLTNPK